MRKLLFCILLLAPLAARGQTREDARATRRSAEERERATELQLRKFNQFYDYLNAYYVDTLDNHALVEDAIEEMLSDLDPHSSYISAKEMKAVRESFEGSFSGVGVEFDILSDTLIVVNTVPGGPARELGVIANDRITEVDGRSVIGIDRADVPKLLRGPRGTSVDLKVIRPGVSEPMVFHVTRDEIPIHPVDAAYLVDATTGYIKVNSFAENTMSEFRDAFGKFGDIDALILDLRGNGGGLLTQAVEMSEFFLERNDIIVSIRGLNYENTEIYSRRKGEFDGVLIVLIDPSSASASEIVSGAVQDWDRGLIIGQQSFGKGLVQRQIELLDGSAVRITSAHYFTPSGRMIQRPFEKGNSEAYYSDHLRRISDRSYADSLAAGAPAFKTHDGRTVYGGSGITPDIEVPVDTTRNFSYFNYLVRAGVMNTYVNTYLRRERDNLAARYPDFESFDAGFVVTPAMMAELEAAGKTRGVERPAAPADTSDATNSRTADAAGTDSGGGGEVTASTGTQPAIEPYIKALVAQKLWGTNEYYRVINREDDPDFARAVEVIRDWAHYKHLLETE